MLAAVALTLVGATGASAFQRDQIEPGFQLDQLVALGGAGPDPGPANLQARLDWALATAIPLPWRRTVPVVWSVRQVTPGHLALSYYDGTVEVSPRLLRGTSEEVLSTVAHEMGHQIVISLVSVQDGSPPSGFIDFTKRSAYRSVDEGWADCVSRAWTGSVHYTQTEAGPCSNATARYVASLLSDPQNLKVGRIVALPAPLPTFVQESPPEVEPAPAAAPSPVPRPEPEPAKSQLPIQQAAGRSAGISPGMMVIGALLLMLGGFGLVALVRKLVPDTGPQMPRK